MITVLSILTLFSVIHSTNALHCELNLQQICYAVEADASNMYPMNYDLGKDCHCNHTQGLCSLLGSDVPYIYGTICTHINDLFFSVFAIHAYKSCSECEENSNLCNLIQACNDFNAESVAVKTERIKAIVRSQIRKKRLNLTTLKPLSEVTLKVAYGVKRAQSMLFSDLPALMK